MSSSLKVRFAPSPTGQVHIGNIRTAIFNYLLARNRGGEFLLRVEDTDLERSTQDALDKMLESMEWLGLDYDGEIFRQSRHAADHVKAADSLIANGKAYKPKSKDGGPVPVLFAIPWDTDDHPAVRTVGDVEQNVHSDEPVVIAFSGVTYAQISKKGKPVPTTATLAGFHDLKVFDISGELLFDINDVLDDVLNNGRILKFENCARITFQRREVFYEDLIKGRLAKPLDTMKDLVILRSDGSPVFHLANVVDDAAQDISFIIRGDDHVENTYRHIFLFHALGFNVPEYGHMPMIVNERGKPFSKRDGDAFVGDFRLKGYLPEALFNYLALLGWSPGDDREKMSKNELVEAFSLDRVISSPAQFDFAKLANLNGRYIAELSNDDFIKRIADFAEELELSNVVDWMNADSAKFANVADLMRDRCKNLSDVEGWAFFFEDDIITDAKLAEKTLKPEIVPAIAKFAEIIRGAAGFAESDIESAISEAEQFADLASGKLMRPLRVAATGAGSGADLVPSLILIGCERLLDRLDNVSR